MTEKFDLDMSNQVEKILRVKYQGVGRNKVAMYLVKWVGSSKRSWVSRDELDQQVLEQFHQSKRQKKLSKSQEKYHKNKFDKKNKQLPNKLTKKQRKDKNKSKDAYSSEGEEISQKTPIYSAETYQFEEEEEEQEKKLTFPRLKRGDFGQKNDSQDEDNKSLPEHIQQLDRQGDIQLDIIEKVLQVERIDGKWMAKVKFVDQRFNDKWIYRDFLRIISPQQLLNYYRWYADNKYRPKKNDSRK